MVLSLMLVGAARHLPSVLSYRQPVAEGLRGSWQTIGLFGSKCGCYEASGDEMSCEIYKMCL